MVPMRMAGGVMLRGVARGAHRARRKKREVGFIVLRVVGERGKEARAQKARRRGTTPDSKCMEERSCLGGEQLEGKLEESGHAMKESEGVRRMVVTEN
jgi:hypothetical protein